MIHCMIHSLIVHEVDTVGDGPFVDPNSGSLDLTYLHPMYDCFVYGMATNYQLDEYYEHSSCGYSTKTFGYIVYCISSTEVKN